MSWIVRGDVMKNPYVGLIEHMQKQGGKNNTPYIQTGVVITSDPLTIKFGDLQLSKNDLLVADYLLPNYARKITIPTTPASGSTTTGSITSIGIPDGTITLTDGLKADDIVALIPTLDEQIYFVLARLVSP